MRREICAFFTPHFVLKQFRLVKLGQTVIQTSVIKSSQIVLLLLANTTVLNHFTYLRIVVIRQSLKVPINRQSESFTQVVNEDRRISWLDYAARTSESPVTFWTIESIQSNGFYDKRFANLTLFNTLCPVFAFPPSLNWPVKFRILLYEFRSKCPNFIIDAPSTGIRCQCEDERMWNNLRLYRRKPAVFFYKSPMVTYNYQLRGGASHSNFPSKLLEVSEFIEVWLLKLLRITWISALI
jgi:hypothetical protein